MKSLRLLIVEDDPELLSGLSEAYQRIFAAHGFDAEVESCSSVEEARALARKARGAPYDLVSLDVNLGDAELTGLDVLDTLNRFQAAWMVVLLTGVETDPTLDATLGETKADDLRRRLRQDAIARFPSERLHVIEKPSATLDPGEADQLLANRLEQIVFLYEGIGRLRYVFRPIEVERLERVRRGRGAKRKFIETTALQWQIRFNCGEIRTLPDMTGFRTLHFLLSRDRAESVTPEEALVNEPKKEKSTSPESTPDPVAEWFRNQGIEWEELGDNEQEKLIRAALSLKFERYRELRGYEDEDDLSPSEESELTRIVTELGPLSHAAETAYQRLKPGDETSSGASPEEAQSHAALAQDDLHSARSNYDRLGDDRRGRDSPVAALFRARMKRVRDCLRENGFADFAQHLEDHLSSTGANWTYHPPEGVEWTT